LKKYKSPRSEQILAELIQAGSKTFQTHEPIKSVCNKEVSDQRKEAVILPFYKMGNKTDHSNYREISLLST
jgi:hypothetical protein